MAPKRVVANLYSIKYYNGEKNKNMPRMAQCPFYKGVL